MTKLLVVSPHLDDAVFGCGDMIAAHPGAVVVTVFAGGPSEWNEPTSWDARCGFGPGEDVVASRRAEDRNALAVLGASAVWLPFWDSQYQARASVDDIAAKLGKTLTDAAPEVVAIPVGLWHSDHGLTHEASVSLIGHRGVSDWLLYEDAIYRRFPDAKRDVRLDALRAEGITATPLEFHVPASVLKRNSVACYGSQLRGLAAGGQPGWTDALEPESYWALTTTGAR